MSINFDRVSLLDTLLPLFTQVRPTVNYGSPYRTSESPREGKPIIETIDLLGLLLLYLKSSDRQYKLAHIFGLVPSSLSVWIDYALEIMVKIIELNWNSDLRVEWPIATEMTESARLLK